MNKIYKLLVVLMLGVVLNSGCGTVCTQGGLHAGAAYLVQTSNKSEQVEADENGEIHTSEIKCNEIESITRTS
jgi:uncharacterized protein YceK